MATLIPADVALILNTVVEGPSQYDGGGETGTGFGDVTVAMVLRALFAYAVGDAANLDTTNGIVTIKSYNRGRNRIVATIVNGVRTRTSVNLA